MKTPANTLAFRIRLAVLKGMARLLAWAIAPALKPAPIKAEHGSPHGGRIIDGEFKRIRPIDERNATHG